MKILYLKACKWLLSQNKQELTFLVIDRTRHWLSISNLLEKKKHISARMSVPQLLEMSSSILLWKKTLLRYLLEDSDLN